MRNKIRLQRNLFVLALAQLLSALANIPGRAQTVLDNPRHHHNSERETKDTQHISQP
jgi:hypothetical protein